MTRLLPGPTSVVAMYCYFAVVPFIYAVQVVTRSPAPALISFALLALAVGLFARTRLTPGSEPMREGGIAAAMRFFIVVSACWAVVEGLMFGFEAGFRYAVFFTLPPLLFFLVGYTREEVSSRALSVVALTALLVGAEMFYENFSARILALPTWFQYQNYDYVLRRSGRELVQLLYPNYRPTGLLEHVHATTTYVAIGSLVAWGRYLSTARIRWLIVSLLCCSAVVLHGARLSILASTVGLAMLHIYVFYATPQHRLAVRISAIVFTIVVGTLLLTDPFGTVAEYYVPAVTRGDFQIAGNKSYIKDILHDEAARIFGGFLTEIGVMFPWLKLDPGAFAAAGPFLNYPFGLLLGFGQGLMINEVDAASDDAFFLQLFAEFGIIGSIVLGYVIASSVWYAIRAPRRKSTEELGSVLACAAVIFALLVTSIHAGGLQRKAIYGVLFLSLGTLHWYRRRAAPARSAKR